MIRVLSRPSISLPVKSIIPAPEAPDIYVPETLPGFITGIDGSDASKFVLTPSTTKVEKALDKSPLALEYLNSLPREILYDAAGGRLNYPLTGLGDSLYEGLHTDKGLSGGRSITIGATVTPEQLGVNFISIFGVQEPASFSPYCGCGVGTSGTKNQYRFQYGGNIMNVEGALIGRTDSVVFRHEYVSPTFREYTFWLNGVKTQYSSGSPVPAFPATQALTVGSFNNFEFINWRGFINQLAVYNLALSDSDVWKLIAFLDAKK